MNRHHLEQLGLLHIKTRAERDALSQRLHIIGGRLQEWQVQVSHYQQEVADTDARLNHALQSGDAITATWLSDLQHYGIQARQAWERIWHELKEGRREQQALLAEALCLNARLDAIDSQCSVLRNNGMRTGEGQQREQVLDAAMSRTATGAVAS